jgi:hypothetical protein
VTQTAVIYYSATDNLHTLTRAAADSAEGSPLPRRRADAGMLISVKQHSGGHSAEREEERVQSPVRTAGAMTPTREYVLPDSPTDVIGEKPVPTARRVRRSAAAE